MAIVLYRIDERLIHGQVVVGWGGRLSPDRYVVVDEELAESPWEQDLYLLGLPAEVESVFVAPREARERLPEWQRDTTRTVLLTRDVATMVELARGGGLAGAVVNLGGIHHGEGRREVLSYVHLDESDRELLRELEELGAGVTAQDLPGSRRVHLDEIL